MSYQVFARKYRPRSFNDVLGQDHVVRTLRNAIAQNRLAHAYLFVGPRGTGKTSTARIFAKALNCTNGPSVDFDPDDEICQEIAEGRCLDVLEIDGASNNGVDQVRDLRDAVRFAPARCRFKIYYIDEVHMLTTAAFNALLKTLEEPPPHVKFIFATTEANKILPTIISRCQRFDLRRIPNTVIAKHLLHIASLEGVQLDEKAAYAIGKGADGGMRDAQSMLDQLVAFCGSHIREADVLDIFGFTAVEAVAHLAQHILASDTVGALRTVHDQTEAGKDLGRLLGDLIQHFRTVLVHQADPEAALEDLEPEIAALVAEQSQAATTDQLLRVVDGLAEVDARMRWATNKRLHFELGVIQAVQHFNEVSISDVIEALDAGPGGVANLPRPVSRPPAIAPPVRRATAPVSAPATTITAKSETETPRANAPAVAAEVPPAPARVVEATPVAEVPNLRQAIAAAAAPEPEREPEPESLFLAPEEAPASKAPATAEPLDDADFWQALVERVRERRVLISSWLEMATLLSISRNIVKIGFPTVESHARDSLMRDNQRKFLEGLAEEILGTPVKMDMVLDPSLKPPAVSEMHFGFDDPAPAPAPAAAPAPVAEVKPVTAAVPVATTAVAAPAASSEAPAGEAPPTLTSEFYNDPLIQRAIEQFKMKLADT